MMPEQMTCVEITQPGAPEVLTLTKRPSPKPASKEVVIAVAAAGVNRPDILQRQGVYPAPPGASDLPGLEVAGTIVAIGSDVDTSLINTQVCALVAGGGYANLVAVDARLCLPIPKGFTMIEAAALPETFFTVWHNVFERGGLKAGESFLVHGGAGGIGTTAIQLAKALGSRVFTTASASKLERCKELGAEIAIDYASQDFVAILKEATQGKGIDVILDVVGGDYIARNLKSLGMEGRLVSIAFQNGSTAEINFMTMMLKRQTITGSTLRPQSVDAKARMAQSLKEKVWPLLDKGEIKPVIHATYPLAQASEAHKAIEASSHVGKIVLTI
jgi:NADPH2:quinone reductase